MSLESQLLYKIFWALYEPLALNENESELDVVNDGLRDEKREKGHASSLCLFL